VDWVSNLGRALKKAEQVTSAVRVGDHVERLAEAGLRHKLAHILQRREILNGEPDTVEQGDLTRIPASRREPGDNSPEFGDLSTARDACRTS
jgi:hypothetical protein